MLTIESLSDAADEIAIGSAPFEAVSRAEHALEETHIHPDGNDVTEAFLAYVRPLVGPIQPHVRLYP